MSDDKELPQEKTREWWEVYLEWSPGYGWSFTNGWYSTVSQEHAQHMALQSRVWAIRKRTEVVTTTLVEYSPGFKTEMPDPSDPEQKAGK